jgi:hypothetical protein
MDHSFFGIGIDGPVGLLPVIGDLISGFTTVYLLSKASQVRMPFGERLVVLGVCAADIAIGLFAGAGDVADFFFRARTWSAQRVLTHVETQLAQIEQAEHRLQAPRPVGDETVVMSKLRDALFRGGKTQQSVWMRFGVVAAICVTLLGYCSHQEQLRHERVMACEARGEWFCGWF